MSVSIQEFWRLLEESGLASATTCQNLKAEFGRLRGASIQGNAKTLSEWLIAENAISRFHSTILLAGRTGPFFYDEFKISDRVEGGQFSGMYRAEHVPTEHPALLQFHTGTKAYEAQRWSDAVTRIQAYCGIQHPHLLRCYSVIDVRTYRFVVWEQPEGAPMAELIAQRGRLEPAAACRAARCAALALAELHRTGRVAGSLCTGSLWYEPSEDIKLFCDPTLQVSSAFQPERGATRPEHFDYWAPELGQPDRSPDVNTDIYALGCILYELLTGHLPFAGGDADQKQMRHATEAIQPLQPIGVPAAIEKTVTFMMAKNPATRFSTATAVAEALNEFIQPTVKRTQFSSNAATTDAFQKHIARSLTAGMASSADTGFQGISVDSLKFTERLQQPSRAATAAVSTEIDPAPKPPRGVDRGSQTSSVYQNSRSSRHWIPALTAAAVAAAAILVIVAGLLFTSSDEDEQESDLVSTPALPGNDRPETDDRESTDPIDVVIPEEEVTSTTVDDDGTLLWESPTSGAPIEFRYVPAEAQMYLVVRPARMLQNPEGPRTLRALGPEFAATRQRWETATGIGLEQVDRMITAWHPADGRMPRVSIVVYLEEHDAESFAAGWATPQPASNDFGQLYQTAEWSLLIPADADGRVIVMGATEDLDTMIRDRGQSPLLRREMEILRRASDDDRHVTLLLAPNFLFADGRPLFSGALHKLLDPMSSFMGDNLQALSFSLHFGDHFFGELRLAGGLNKPPDELAQLFHERVGRLSDQILNYVASLEIPAYWRKLAIRFPQMMGTLHHHTRAGFQEEHAVLNFASHPHAAHNLALAVQLSIATAPTTTADPRDNRPRTVRDVLARWNMNVSIPQQSLEFTLRDIASDVNEANPQLPAKFRVKILGPDLQLEGITRNQQIREFKVQNQTLAEVLTALVMQANPVANLQDASQPDQKLVWVVAPDPEGAPEEEIILITTRSAAKKNNYQLPAPFLGNANDEKQ